MGAFGMQNQGQFGSGMQNPRLGYALNQGGAGGGKQPQGGFGNNMGNPNFGGGGMSGPMFGGFGRMQDEGGTSVINQLSPMMQQFQQQMQSGGPTQAGLGSSPYNSQAPGAVGLYNQYQNAAPGAAQDALVKQMQGTDAGAGFNQAMKGAGYTLNQGGTARQFSHSPPAAAAPGSLTAAIQAMQQGNPNAQGMLRQTAGLPGQGIDSTQNMFNRGMGGYNPMQFSGFSNQNGMFAPGGMFRGMNPMGAFGNFTDQLGPRLGGFGGNTANPPGGGGGWQY